LLRLIIGLLTSDFAVFDGTTIPNCSSFNNIEWTYNNGQLLSGAAYLYNFVPPTPLILVNTNIPQTNGDTKWKTRVDSLLAAAQKKFFTNGIINEPACESTFNCDIDQMNFKGFLAQYLALVSRMAPYTAPTIQPLLASSALAAASHCNAGTNGSMCTMFWTTTTGPQTLGVGQQMSALNVFNANLLKFVGAAAEVATGNSGGTSVGDPNAGNSNSDQVYTYVSFIPFFAFGLMREDSACYGGG
jgi:mannan endo-1,6-alpha-mannosidase